MGAGPSTGKALNRCHDIKVAPAREAVSLLAWCVHGLRGVLRGSAPGPVHAALLAEGSCGCPRLSSPRSAAGALLQPVSGCGMRFEVANLLCMRTPKPCGPSPSHGQLSNPCGTERAVLPPERRVHVQGAEFGPSVWHWSGWPGAEAPRSAATHQRACLWRVCRSPPLGSHHQQRRSACLGPQCLGRARLGAVGAQRKAPDASHCV